MIYALVVVIRTPCNPRNPCMCYCVCVKSFALGCLIGLLLVLGSLSAFWGGMLAYDGSWGGLVAGAWVSAYLLIGAGLVLRNEMEL